jgi:type II secretory pathway predicted ATPase ExeA
MYEEFYGLSEKPFSIQPDPSFLYWGRGHRLAYAMLEYGVVNQAGISVITGEVGCGKTTLIHRLLDQLSDTHTIALLSNIQSGRGDLLSWVLMGYGEPYAGKTHVEMFSTLQSFFIREYSKGKRVVLIIDEAQNLSIDMLEELRMLSNINAGKDQLLQLILVGQPQLKDLLSRPEMLQLAQRIGSDFHLTPLTREEVHAYIETRLSIAGASRNIFNSEAMDLVAEYSLGVPRVINTIADTALVYAFSAQDDTIGGDIVRSVIRDKLEYGVFGLASSPDLKLSEEGNKKRTISGFLRSEPAGERTLRQQVAEPAQKKKVREMREQPRLVSNLGAKFVTGNVEDYATDAPPSTVAANSAPVYEAPPAPQPAPRSVAAPAPSPEPPAQSGARPAEIGVIIVSDGGGMMDSLGSAPAGFPLVCVVAPGSEDAAAAKNAGVDFVELEDGAFNGGRARNAGYRRMKKIAPNLQLVQFVSSGARISPDWLASAARFMARRPEVSALEGLTQIEDRSSLDAYERVASQLNGSEGEVQASGANVLFRADAFEAAGGFRGDILADETADLCIRLRRRGAHVWRSEDLMAVVPAPAPSFADWRGKMVENGYRYAAGAALHGGPPERYCATEQARAIMWGAIFPAFVVVAAIIAGAGAMLVPAGVNPFLVALSIVITGALIYWLKIAATAAREGLMRPSSWTYAAKATLGHFYEYAGVARYWFGPKKGAAGRKAIA